MSNSGEIDQDLIERVARAICEAKGFDPEMRVGHEPENYIDEKGRSVFGKAPQWRDYIEEAKKLIAVHRVLQT